MVEYEVRWYTPRGFLDSENGPLIEGARSVTVTCVGGEFIYNPEVLRRDSELRKLVERENRKKDKLI
ncbi:hypothetical protein ACFL0X_01030 [Nanoarchaeota archaeon]